MDKIYAAFDRCRRLVPGRARAALRRWLSLGGYDAFLWRQKNPYAHEPAEYRAEGAPFTAGIFKDRPQYHRHWIGACRDLGISYRLIDLAAPDWMERVREAGCDLFLVWPDVSSPELKTMFDERLEVMVRQLHQTVYPSLPEIRLYENKRRQHYWLKANGFPVPRTWIFYGAGEAMDFARGCAYPIVFKCNLGGASRGVFVLKGPGDSRKLIRQAFGAGVRLKRGDRRTRQRGSVYFQEYLPDVKEWRMVRVGGSYFGHGKERAGLYHSGSRKVNWDVPAREAFDLLRTITDKGAFSSMDVDLFETPDGAWLVNELQTVFGTSIAGEQMHVDGQPGRYVYADGGWRFEPGRFGANHMCNLRLAYVIDNLINRSAKRETSFNTARRKP